MNYLTTKELCKAFSVSARTVLRWQKSGCPCLRIGKDGTGAPRFNQLAVENWLLAQGKESER